MNSILVFYPDTADWNTLTGMLAIAQRQGRKVSLHVDGNIVKVKVGEGLWTHALTADES